MSDAPLPIETRELSKTYRLGFFMNRKVRALQGVSLSVRPGEVYGLLGPNGAGKSTTIKILMNLVQASSGEARLFGQPSQDCAARQEVGFLPENPAPYEYLSGAEFVRLAGSLGGLFGRELDRRVAETLGEVGMEHAASLPIRRYSKGMIQRIGLAQAIVTRPKLLILDEPTSGLDPVGRRQMRDLVSAERARGTTVLFCTHIIPDVEALCDRVAVLVSGKLVKEGSVRDLVTSQVPLVELVIEGLGLSQVRALGEPLQFEQEIGQRVTVRTDDAAGQRLLRAVLSAGGRVAQLSPARFSLEDLFMETVAGAKQKVGGEIN